MQALLAAAALAASPAPAVVADHLDNPRGLSVDSAGTLWAAEAGDAGAHCLFHGFICYGRSGKILRVAGGSVSVFARGLASIRTSLGTVGVDDVSVGPGGSVFTAMITDDTLLPKRARKRALAGQLGKLLRFDSTGRRHLQARLTVSSPFSHPYAVLALSGHQLVTDSEQNTLLDVTGSRARVIFHFPHTHNFADSVPTALAEGPDGAVYIGELAGIGAGRGHARVWRMLPGQRPRIFATGFNAIIGLAFGPDGSLYVCEFSRDFDHQDPNGDVVRVAPDGTRTRLGVGRLVHPGGVAVAQDGSVYVSNRSTSTGRGQILKFS